MWYVLYSVCVEQTLWCVVRNILCDVLNTVVRSILCDVLNTVVCGMCYTLYVLNRHSMLNRHSVEQSLNCGVWYVLYSVCVEQTLWCVVCNILCDVLNTMVCGMQYTL